LPPATDDSSQMQNRIPTLLNSDGLTNFYGSESDAFRRGAASFSKSFFFCWKGKEFCQQAAREDNLQQGSGWEVPSRSIQ
jgi:hypothetical protein